MSAEAYTNNYAATVATAALTTASTSVAVSPALPTDLQDATKQFRVMFGVLTGAHEFCIGVYTDSTHFALTRAQENTTAQAWPISTPVTMMVTAGTMRTLAPLSGAVLTGATVAAEPAVSDDSLAIAPTSFVQDKITNVLASYPTTAEVNALIAQAIAGAGGGGSSSGAGKLVVATVNSVPMLQDQNANQFFAKGIVEWIIKDNTTGDTGSSDFADYAWPNLDAIVAAEQARGINLVRIRAHAGYYNSLTVSAQAAYAEQYATRLTAAKAANQVMMVCPWDGTDAGPSSTYDYSGIKLATMYTELYPMMNAITAACENDDALIWDLVNEPNDASTGAFTWSLWETMTKGLILNLRDTADFTGLINANPIDWSNSGPAGGGFNDAAYTLIEQYDATLLSGHHQISFATHQYWKSEWDGLTQGATGGWNTTTFLNTALGGTTTHLIFPSEVGYDNGAPNNGSVPWYASAVAAINALPETKTNLVGIVGFIAGWVDDNTIFSISDFTTLTTVGQAFFNALGGGSVPTNVSPPVVTNPSGGTTEAMDADWTLTQTYTFPGTTLSGTDWSTYSGANGSGAEWDAALITVANGMVNLAGSSTNDSGMKTNNSWTYGRWEITAYGDADPDGNSGNSGWAILLWPTSQNWPEEVEIDITETDGARDMTHGTIHFGANDDNPLYLPNMYYLGGEAFDGTKSHVYALEWLPSGITLWIDDIRVWAVNGPSAAIPSTDHFLGMQFGGTTAAGAALHVTQIKVFDLNTAASSATPPTADFTDTFEYTETLAEVNGGWAQTNNGLWVGANVAATADEPAVAAGVATIPLTTDYPALYSIMYWDLTGGSCYVKMTPPAVGTGTKEVDFILNQLPAGFSSTAGTIYLSWRDGGPNSLLYAGYYDINGIETIGAEVAVTASSPVWVKFSELNGELTFAYSTVTTPAADSDWTTLYTVATSTTDFDPTHCYPTLQAGYYGTESASDALFSDFNTGAAV